MAEQLSLPCRYIFSCNGLNRSFGDRVVIACDLDFYLTM